MFFFNSLILIFSHDSLIGIAQIKLSKFMNFLFSSFIFLIHQKIVLHFLMKYLFIIFFDRFKPLCLVNLPQNYLINLHSSSLMICFLAQFLVVIVLILILRNLIPNCFSFENFFFEFGITKRRISHVIHLIFVIFMGNFFFHATKLTRARLKLKCVSKSWKRTETSQWRNVGFDLFYLCFSIFIIFFFQSLCKIRLLIKRRMSSKSVCQSWLLTISRRTGFFFRHR